MAHCAGVRRATSGAPSSWSTQASRRRAAGRSPSQVRDAPAALHRAPHPACLRCKDAFSWCSLGSLVLQCTSQARARGAARESGSLTRRCSSPTRATWAPLRTVGATARRARRATAQGGLPTAAPSRRATSSPPVSRGAYSRRACCCIWATHKRLSSVVLGFAELDLDDNSLRFYLNGRDQGVAFRVRCSPYTLLLLLAHHPR